MTAVSVVEIEVIVAPRSSSNYPGRIRLVVVVVLVVVPYVGKQDIKNSVSCRFVPLFGNSKFWKVLFFMSKLPSCIFYHKCFRYVWHIIIVSRYTYIRISQKNKN